jgi:hypothetical protein
MVNYFNKRLCLQQSLNLHSQPMTNIPTPGNQHPIERHICAPKTSITTALVVMAESQERKEKKRGGEGRGGERRGEEGRGGREEGKKGGKGKKKTDVQN